MGLFDQLTETVNDVVGSNMSAQITSALGQTDLGNLRGIVNQLWQGGLEEQVKSWLGSGANLPVTAEEIRSALGNSQVVELAKQFGIPIDAALQLLAQHLPAVVDQASPNGVIQDS